MRANALSAGSGFSRLGTMVVLGSLLLMTSGARGAAITWSAATNITGDSDVSTTGTLVGALNFGTTGVASTTVNGVLFDAFVVPNGAGPVTLGNFTFNGLGNLGSANTLGSGAGPFNGLSAAYKALLSTGAGGFANQFTALAMDGLTIGSTYQFQWWWNDSAGLFQNSTATAGNAVTLDANTTNTAGGLGQFAIGTFTADATSQNITFNNSAFQYGLNGIQLRDVTPAVGPSGPGVPLPAAFWTGLALSGALLIRRTPAGAAAGR